MRTVDTTALTFVGTSTFGPWLLDRDRLLRTYRLRQPITCEEEAQLVFDAYRTAFEATSVTPRPLEVVRTSDGFGVVVEYVRGMSLAQHLALGSYTPREAGEALAGLLRQLHAGTTDVGRDLNDTFRTWSTKLATLLPPEMSTRLVSLVDAVDNPHALVHGDIHLRNVIVRKGRLALIDLELAGFGHPIIDLAIAYSRIMFDTQNGKTPRGITPDVADRAITSLWDALIETYFEDASQTEREGLIRQIKVLAEIDHCCFRHGMASVGEEGLTERQHKRLAVCEKRLGELLHRVRRPGFS